MPLWLSQMWATLTCSMLALTIWGKFSLLNLKVQSYTGIFGRPSYCVQWDFLPNPFPPPELLELSSCVVWFAALQSMMHCLWLLGLCCKWWTALAVWWAISREVSRPGGTELGSWLLGGMSGTGGVCVCVWLSVAKVLPGFFASGLALPHPFGT